MCVVLVYVDSIRRETLLRLGDVSRWVCFYCENCQWPETFKMVGQQRTLLELFARGRKDMVRAGEDRVGHPTFAGCVCLGKWVLLMLFLKP